MKARAALVIGFALLPALLAGCGGSGNNDRTDDGALAVNSGMAIGSTYPDGLVAVGDVLVFLVSESEQAGTDLNGDGDAADNVVHILDPATGVIVNTGFAGAAPLASNDGFAAFVVPEADQGGTDLNGDGDASDRILAVVAPGVPVGPGNPVVTPFALADGSPVAGSGDFFAVIASELYSAADLTADGDLDDLVVRVFDTALMGTFDTPLPLDPAAPFFALNHGVVVFQVSEADLGPTGTDLNGDLDASDILLFGAHIPLAMLFPVGPGGSARMAAPESVAVFGTVASPVIGYAIDESGSGVNVNTGGLVFDDDTSDFVPALFFVSTLTEYVPGRVATRPGRFTAGSTHFVMVADEADNGPLGTDFNGDGDTEDAVPFWVALASPLTPVNTGLATPTGDADDAPVLCGMAFVFLAEEALQGISGTNYNGAWSDSDTDDLVAFYIDMTVPGLPPVNLGLAATETGAGEDGSWIVVILDEEANGSLDFTGDGESDDLAVGYFPVIAGDPVFPAHIVLLDGNTTIQECATTVRIVSFVAEGSDDVFEDMNQDGDLDDWGLVFRQLEKSTGALIATEFGGTVDPDAAVASFPFVIGAGGIALPGAEGSVSTGLNLNGASGDSDAGDVILLYVRTDCP